MRVLFFDNNDVLMSLLPEGFRNAGHDAGITGKKSEKEIAAVIASFKPDFIVVQGWGTLSGNAAFQQEIGQQARQARIPLVYWSVEDPIWTQGFVLPLLNRMNPDFLFTICPTMVSYYEKKGIKTAHLDFGCHIGGPPQKKEEKYDVALVANTYSGHESYYKYRNRSLEVLLDPLLKNNIRVDFWGRGWKAYGEKLGISIPEQQIHPPLSYANIQKIYHSSKIMLCPQNFGEQLTMRTYDILGSGSFLLTIQSPAVERLFKHGRDLAVSSSPEETVQLVKHYLMHPKERNRIGNQGKKAVSKYTYQHRAQQMIQELRKRGVI